MTYVELCAGAAATTLRLLGGGRLLPPVSFMGGKRAYSADLLRILDVRREDVDRIILVDAGPWGWVWPLVFEAGAEVAGYLEQWDRDLDVEGPRELWERLSVTGPPAAIADRSAWHAAQWLWLQARSASGVPVWWGPDLNENGWRMGEEPKKAVRATRTIAQCSGAHGWLAEDGSGTPRAVGQRSDRHAHGFRMGSDPRERDAEDIAIGQKGGGWRQASGGDDPRPDLKAHQRGDDWKCQSANASRPGAPSSARWPTGRLSPSAGTRPGRMARPAA
jgi:hypothetical protein